MSKTQWQLFPGSILSCLCCIIQHRKCRNCNQVSLGGVRLVTSIAIELHSLCVSFSSVKFDSGKIPISLKQWRIVNIDPLHFSEILMRKIKIRKILMGKAIAMCICSMISQARSPLLLVLQPVPFSLTVWQLSQLQGACPTRIRT